MTKDQAAHALVEGIGCVEAAGPCEAQLAMLSAVSWLIHTCHQPAVFMFCAVFIVFRHT
jgi:hypothetical protein